MLPWFFWLGGPVAGCPAVQRLQSELRGGVRKTERGGDGPDWIKWIMDKEWIELFIRPEWIIANITDFAADFCSEILQNLHFFSIFQRNWIFLNISVISVKFRTFSSKIRREIPILMQILRISEWIIHSFYSFFTKIVTSSCSNFELWAVQK